ncbi:MAG: hypothetical protein MR775_05115 [Erysipelotrichaceae bacterium]|nr:hypothetical protein [Erysipelotrichaceae bacterium]
MAIFEQNVDISSFIKITQGGIQVASFADIRDTLIKQMKRIYGNDIDVNSANADGQWINSIALIINNMCQVIQYSYDMLDPASATGSFLDILCSYNNISRINETASTAQLYVKNISGVAQTNVKFISFIDKAGKEWLWKNPGINQADGSVISPNNVISWDAEGDGAIQLLTDVECQELGANIAIGNGTDISKVDWNSLNEDNSGFINQTVEYGKWKVYQQTDAVVGNVRETDESLRSRRIQSMGNQATTVLSGLEGAILNIEGIKDVWAYDNKSTTDEIMDDGTVVPQHCTYICVRYDENAHIDKSILGSLIYNKMTPGIPTIPYAGLSYTKILTQPADWIQNYSKYTQLTATANTSSTWSANTIYSYDSVNNVYILTTSQPDNWSTTFGQYYQLQENATVETFTDNTNVCEKNQITGEVVNYQINKASNLTYNIYWKKCTPYTFLQYDEKTDGKTTVKYGIKVQLMLVNNSFNFATNRTNGTLHHAESDVEKSIVNDLLYYLNNISLGEDLNATSISSVVQKADINKNAMSTFFAIGTSIKGATDTLLNLKNTYLQFTESDIYFETPETSGNIYSTGYIYIKVAD